MNPDKGLLDWAGLPGPRKVLAAARRRLDQGSDLTGSPLRVSLTADERKEVGKLLGMTWAHSGRAVSAWALAKAIGNLGTDVPELLAAIGTPIRDLRGARIAARQGAEEERERAVTALTDADVPADVVSTWSPGADCRLRAAANSRVSRRAARACGNAFPTRTPAGSCSRCLPRRLSMTPTPWTAAVRSLPVSCDSSAMSFQNQPKCGGPPGKNTGLTATWSPHVCSSSIFPSKATPRATALGQQLLRHSAEPDRQRVRRRRPGP